MSLLELQGVSKEGEDGFVLDTISFKQESFQKIAIAGETGSGKSTLLKIIAGLVQPDTGTVFFDGEEVVGPNDKLVPGHPSIAYLSQHFELQRFLRVEQILSYANHLEENAATSLFEVCQIEHLLKRKTDQLSGGERQRIALARLLVGSPRLLILDEPFSNLDFIHKSTLKEVIRRIAEELKITLILVSHDPSDTLPWADQILVMKNGKVIQQGSPTEIYRNPVDEYVAGLFGKFSVRNDLPADFLTEASHWMIRPEDWVISENGKGINTVVQNVYFYGSYNEAELKINNESVFIHTPLQLEKGQKISVRLSDQ